MPVYILLEMMCFTRISSKYFPKLKGKVYIKGFRFLAFIEKIKILKIPIYEKTIINLLKAMKNILYSKVELLLLMKIVENRLEN